jgi:hypothetical protein
MTIILPTDNDKFKVIVGDQVLLLTRDEVISLAQTLIAGLK